MLLLFYRNAGAAENTGQASQAVTVTQVATAVLSIEGAAAQSVVIAQTAQGSSESQGEAAQSVAVAQTATGVLSVQGSASQTVTILQSAAGTLSITGTADQTIAITQTADGTASVTPIEGTANQTVQITQASTGILPIIGSAAQNVIIGQLATNQVARAGGVSGKRRAPVVDVIWPDDPRHPNYIAPLAALAELTPKRIAPNVIRVPKVAARQVAEPVQITQERPRYDAEIAILLLAA